MSKSWEIKDGDVGLYLEACRHVVASGRGWPWSSQGQAEWLVTTDLDEDSYPDGETLKSILITHLNEKAVQRVRARARLVKHRRQNSLATIQVHRHVGHELSQFAKERGLTLTDALTQLLEAQKGQEAGLSGTA